MKKNFYLTPLFFVLLFSIQVYSYNNVHTNNDLKAFTSINVIKEETLILENDFVDGTLFESLDYFLKIKNGSLNDIGEVLITRGTLPDGLELSENYLGRIVGNPIKSGIFIVYIKVSNQNGESNEAKITFNIKKIDYQLDPLPFGDPQIRCRKADKIELPKDADNINIPIIYESNNDNIAKVDRNILECKNLGSVIVTAKLDENDQYESNNSTFNVDVVDPNDASKSYVGLGKFKPIADKEEILEGYYVIASGNYAMSNFLENKELKATEININSDKIIVNPNRNIVWKFKVTPPSDLNDPKIKEVSIYNENIEKYLKDGYDYLDFDPYILGDYNFMEIKQDKNNKKGELFNFSIGDILFKNDKNQVFVNSKNSNKSQNLQLYKLIDSSLIIDDKTISKNNSIRIYKKAIDVIEINSENKKIESLTIYDFSGKLLMELNKINQNKYEVNKPLKKGIYIFNIHLENGKVINQKFLN